ncbi:MAG: hypothetical protein WB988_05100, partial [Candidatus Nitrosopolaris sp.]
HPIYSYQNVQARLSFCTYFLLYPLVITLQDWSVNHVRNLKCQPCMEAAQLRNKGIGVEYMIFDDEGHGFTKYSNLIKALKKSAEFLANGLSLKNQLQ